MAPVRRFDLTTIFTIGHSTRPLSDLLALLQNADVAQLVDVRAVPWSRFNPQYNQKTLAAFLAAAGVAYRHMPALGGRRAPIVPVAESPNRLWGDGAFRAYADYALTEEFRHALNALEDAAAARTAAVMCAEKDWRNCHRRMIADRLLADGHDVRHIVGPGEIEPAVLTPGAERRSDGTVVYPAEEPRMPRLPGL